VTKQKSQAVHSVYKQRAPVKLLHLLKFIEFTITNSFKIVFNYFAL